MRAFGLLLFLIVGSTFAQEEGTSIAQIQKVVNETLSSKWYEKIQLKGYAQFRYSRFMETNSDFTHPTNDKSIGDNKGLFLRRGRLNFFGEVTSKVYIYIQGDYAQDAGDDAGQNYFQLRDAYFDYALSENKEWRVRTGISKVPYAFENLQSSSTRPAFDRSDALNSGVPSERDTGVFIMYAPSEVRKRFKELTSNSLKGAGDYGMIVFGAYNGQGLNNGEENNDLHRVIRFTYPFKLDNGQFIEASLQAYEGTYTTGAKDYYDQRSAASLIFYPQPIGFQMEYNIGQGPEFDKDLGASGELKVSDLAGGYAQVNYQTFVGNHRFFPYLRYQEYEGGRKTDSSYMETREWELGSEWQPHAALELTVAYAISERLLEKTGSSTDEKGQLLRLQAQFNY